MKKNKLSITAFLLIFLSGHAWSQGPPITTDKPIMLGANRKIVKTLTEHRVTKTGSITRIPIMLHYLPTSNIMVALHIPWVRYQVKNRTLSASGANIGDLQVLGKYQFYRNDKIGKTFRMVAKTLQSLPTGNSLGIDGISTGQYQAYTGLVAGYESIKYGISNEIGFNYHPSGSNDELRYKLGFGLPMLKPIYPVKQLNLYFEYISKWFITRDEYQLLYAQGIQFAKGRFTYEAAIQMPLIQEISLENQYRYSLFFGTRYVF